MPQQQQRPMTTTAAGAQQAQGQRPGLFGQMASTAAGVAVGSSIGHAIGGWFGGGSAAQEYPEQQQQNYTQQGQDAYAQPMDNGLYNTQQQGYASQQQPGVGNGPCAVDVKNFTSCMNQNGGDLNVCGWYLEQMKACQAAARQY